MSATERLERIHLRAVAEQATRDLPATDSYDDALAIMASLPDALVRARRHRNLTLRAAARQIGVSYRTLYDWETGTRLPTGPTMVATLRWIQTVARLPCLRGYCSKGLHPQSPDTVYTHPINGSKVCKPCRRAWRRERKRRQAGAA